MSRVRHFSGLVAIFVISCLVLWGLGYMHGDNAHAQFTPPTIQFKGTLPTVIGDCVLWNSTNGQYVKDGGACPGLAGLLVSTANGFKPTLTGSPIPTLTVSFNPALASGIVKNTTATGVASIAADCADTYSTACFSGLMALQSANNVNITGGTITGMQLPAASSDVATKGYVDTTEAALNPALGVQAATIAVLPNTPTYNNGFSGVGATLIATSNGALVIDGYTVQVGDRLLIKDQASAFQNGIYFVSATGTAGTPYALGRAVNFDTINNMNAIGLVPVYNGTVNQVTSWTITSTIATVGTDAITFTQYNKTATTIVTGPASATDGNPACFNGSTGKLLKDCGTVITAAKYVWNSTDTIATMNFIVPVEWSGTTTMTGVMIGGTSGSITWSASANGATTTGCNGVTTTLGANVTTACTANNTLTQGQLVTVTISGISSPVGPAYIAPVLSHAIH